MFVVSERFPNTHLLHEAHGSAIGLTVCLVGARAIQHQALAEGLMILRHNLDVGVALQMLDRVRCGYS